MDTKVKSSGCKKCKQYDEHCVDCRSELFETMWSNLTESRIDSSSTINQKQDLNILRSLKLEIFITKDHSILRLSLLELIAVALGLTKIPGMPIKLAKANLAKYGISITKDGFLFIATNNRLLEQKLQEQVDIINLKIYLNRLPQAKPAKHARRLLNNSSRGFLVDLTFLLGTANH